MPLEVGGELIPNYYRKINRNLYHIEYWFLLEELDVLPERQLENIKPILLHYDKDDFSLRTAKRLNLDYNSDKFGAEGYPYPCFCNFEGIPEIVDVSEKSKLKRLPKYFQPNDDYTVIIYKGSELKFTNKQAPILETLTIAWRKGNPFVSRESLLKSVGAKEGRIRDKFRSRENEWDRIVEDLDGKLFRLTLPDS